MKSASVYECGRTWSLHLRDKPIRTWELLRFHCKLEKSSDEVEDVKDDRPSARIRAIDLLASRLTL